MRISDWSSDVCSSDLSLPEDAREKVVRGCYRFGHYAAIDQAKPDAVAADDAARTPRAAQDRVALLGSGAILPEAIKAAERLARMGIASDVYSVTSWSELARDGQRCEAGELSGQAKGQAFVNRELSDSKRSEEH